MTVLIGEKGHNALYPRILVSWTKTLGISVMAPAAKQINESTLKSLFFCFLVWFMMLPLYFNRFLFSRDTRQTAHRLF